MFLQLSYDKLFTLGMVLATLIALIALFVVSNSIWSITPRISQFTARSQAEMQYFLAFKLPGVGSRVASAASTSTAEARAVPVLVYHGEGEDVHMPRSLFVEHMRTLQEAGWSTITMSQFEAFMRGESTVPDRSFVLTFDDGRKDTYYGFDPVLRDFGFTAVMFVITEFSLPDDPKFTSSFYLSRLELQHMFDTGRWEFESHGEDDHRIYKVQPTTDQAQRAASIEGHFLSNKFWLTEHERFETDQEFAARIAKDFRVSKEKLEQVFGITVSGFAYPFNDYGQQMRNFSGVADIIAREAQKVYEFAYEQVAPGPGSFNYPGTGTYRVKRIEVAGDWSGTDLLEILDTGRSR